MASVENTLRSLRGSSNVQRLQASDLKLRAWRPSVLYLHVVGGTGAVSDDVKNAAANAAWGP